MRNNNIISWSILILAVIAAVMTIIKLISLFADGSFWGFIFFAAITFVLLIAYQRLQKK